MVSTAVAPSDPNRTAIFSIALFIFVNHACEALVSFVCLSPLAINNSGLYSFYCIVLLTTLFVSSCYWQPFPLDSQLSVPWSENVTTFAEALNATIMPNHSQPLPSVMRAADRCWCDFSGGDFFEPFNISRWEQLSVRRLKDDLEFQQKVEETRVTELEAAQATQVQPTDTSDMPRTAAPAPSARTLGSIMRTSGSSVTDWWSLLRTLRQTSVGRPSSEPMPSQPVVATQPPEDHVEKPIKTQDLPLIRREYDLRPYGFGILIDFGWTR